MLNQEQRIDGLETPASVFAAENNALSRGVIQFACAVSIGEHLVYGVRQGKIGFQNRDELQACRFAKRLGVNGAYPSAGEDQIEYKQIKVIELIFVLLNLRADAFTLNGDPIISFSASSI